MKRKAKQVRFVAEYTSSDGRYASIGFNAPNYEVAYTKAASVLKGKPRWAIGAVAPKSENKVDTTPLGNTYVRTLRKIKQDGYFRYRA